MVMLPAPTFLLPSQRKSAPLPRAWPSDVDFASGSILAQGDQASHLWKSLTCANTADGGADMVAERVTLNVDGRVAMKMANSTTTTAIPMSMLRNMIL